MFRLQIEELAHAARIRATPRGATAENGLASVRGTVAMARSVGSGDWVRLADIEGAV